MFFSFIFSLCLCVSDPSFIKKKQEWGYSSVDLMLPQGKFSLGYDTQYQTNICNFITWDGGYEDQKIKARLGYIRLTQKEND